MNSSFGLRFDITLSPGNDVYINPSFTDDDGRPMGDIDARNYAPNRQYDSAFNLDVPDLLRFEFVNEKDLLIYSYRVAGTVGLMMAKILKVKSNLALTSAIDLVANSDKLLLSVLM